MDNQIRDERKPTETTMKKYAVVALAILSVVLGTASLIAPANASAVYLFQASSSTG